MAPFLVPACAGGGPGLQHREQGAEGQQHRLQHDAVETRLVARRDRAREQAFEQRMERCADRRPALLEDGGHGRHEAADQSAPQVQARAAGELAGIGQCRVPGEGRGERRQQQQQAVLLTVPLRVIVPAPRATTAPLPGSGKVESDRAGLPLRTWGSRVGCGCRQHNQPPS